MQEILSKKFLNSVLRFISGTALSRIFGLIRDIITAYCFGTNAAIAAFFIAYRLSHLFRRVFAEGGMLTGFVPFYQEKSLYSEKRAHLFFRDLTWSLFIILIGLIALFEGLIAVAKGMGYNYQTLNLTAIMLPSLLFICLYGLFSAYLHCYERFFLSSAAPVFLNIFWILAVVVFRHSQRAMEGLSLFVVIGFFVQWLIVIVGSRGLLVRYISIKEWLKPNLFSKEIKEMIAPFFIATIGISATQINSALDVVFARFASLEGPAYLSYGIRIQQLPLAFFAIALATTLLPLLSRAFQNKEIKEFKILIEHAFSKSLLFLIPVVFGIWMVGFLIINMLFGHGSFDIYSVKKTTECFWAYGLSLIPIALVILMTPAFYAQKNYTTPTILSVASIAMNLLLNAILIFGFHLDAYAVAMNTGITSLLHFYTLFSILKKSYGSFISHEVKKSVFQFLIASLLASFGVWIFYQIALIPVYLPLTSFHETMPTQIHLKVIHFACAFTLFGLIYFGSLLAMGTKELANFTPTKKRLNIF